MSPDQFISVIPAMIDLLASGIVILAGAFLLGLGVLSVAAPSLARRFLLGFARSPGLHYLELALRLVAGGAFLAMAPAMWPAPVFAGIGWVLLLTSIGLLLVPWRWHRRFAQQAVPVALRFLPLLGVASFCMGVFVLFGLLEKAA